MIWGKTICFSDRNRDIFLQFYRQIICHFFVFSGNKKGGIGAIAGSGLLTKKGLGSGQSAKKGIFGKVGKFAVAGIAAYGTYKLAKTLTKGLRRGYDDDDCWEYSILR